MEAKMKSGHLLVISLVLLALIGAACKPAGPVRVQTGPGASVPGETQTPSTGQPEYEDRAGLSATGDSSGVTSTTTGLPDGWPQDVPVMEGFTIRLGKIDAQGMMSVSATGDVSLDDVVNFYSNLQGWEKDPNVPWVTEGPSRMLKLIRGSENLVVNVFERQNQTELTLTYFTRPD
jgi:hypothetical protein